MKMEKIIKYVLIALLIFIAAEVVIAVITAWLGLPLWIAYLVVFLCGWQIGRWLLRRL